MLTRETTTSFIPAKSMSTQDQAFDGAEGFEHDLVKMFAQNIGMAIEFIVANNDQEIHERLQHGEAQLAAAWQIPTNNHSLPESQPFFESKNILVTHEASLPITDLSQLRNKSIHVLARSRQEQALEELKGKIPNLHITRLATGNELDLLATLAEHRAEAVLVNNAEFEIGASYYPELQNSMEIGGAKPIVWLFSPHTPKALIEQANEFLKKIEKSGELERLKDRYFGHIHRLTGEDTIRFIASIQSTLPRYRKLFQNAQKQSGIDWRLLAAIAYQESQWDPLATSPTGVRGMMMLTEETADALRVSNRLDANQSILAGATYLNTLRSNLPNSIKEPDRLWLALAGYNLGLGHLRAARGIALGQKNNPDSWFEMKKVLPLLAKPEYYSHLKSGRGRGGEAVIMVENIRMYYDILNRREPPLSDTSLANGEENNSPSLRPKLLLSTK